MKLLSNIYINLLVGYITIYTHSRNNSLNHIHIALSRVGLEKFKTEVIHTDDPEKEGTIIARRFNIGNFGKHSVVILKGVDTLHDSIDYSAFFRFANELLNIASFDSSPEIIINCKSYEELQIESKPKKGSGILFHGMIGPNKPFFCKEKPSSSKSFFRKLKDKIKGRTESSLAEEVDEETNAFEAIEAFEGTEISHHDKCFSIEEAEETEKDIVNKEEDRLIQEIELDKKAYLDRISAVVLDYVTRFNEVPPIEELEEILRGKLSIASNKLSPITVNNDLKVILPAYNELELRFSPILRTIYILFLCHPEGIILKQIGNYRNEIENIYLLIKPGGDDNRMKQTIDDLCDPFSDSLRQKLSKINRIVKNSIINPELSTRYIIDGSKGEAYKISLDNTQITMPKCLN